MTRKESYIAGWKTPSDWYDFREALLRESSQELWQQAFEEYFKERLSLRYFDPIQVLQETETYSGQGFSIMAILCTLIEFLESTVKGLKYKYVRNNKDLKEFEYNLSGGIFVKFLSNREPFSEHFDEDLALDFYKNVRCGLLHEAQTKGGWTIWAESPDGIIVNKDEKVVYRNHFREAFNIYINDYGKKLLTDKRLQEAFIRKFDFICEET